MICLPNTVLWKFGNVLKGAFLLLNWFIFTSMFFTAGFTQKNLTSSFFVFVFNGNLNYDSLELIPFLLSLNSWNGKWKRSN